MAGKHTWFERLGHESYPIVRYLPDEQRTSVRQLEWMTAKHANALEARAALADELAEALQVLYDEQNGPPLAKYAIDWQRAMDMASTALDRYTALVAAQDAQQPPV